MVENPVTSKVTVSPACSWVPPTPPGANPDPKPRHFSVEDSRLVERRISPSTIATIWTLTTIWLSCATVSVLPDGGEMVSRVIPSPGVGGGSAVTFRTHGTDTSFPQVSPAPRPSHLSTILSIVNGREHSGSLNPVTSKVTVSPACRSVPPTPPGPNPVAKARHLPVEDSRVTTRTILPSTIAVIWTGITIWLIIDSVIVLPDGGDTSSRVIPGVGVGSAEGEVGLLLQATVTKTRTHIRNNRV